MGRYYIPQNYKRGGVDAYALNIFIHPNWKFYTRDYESDIAIIILASPVGFSDIFYPICMWQSNEPRVVKFGYIVGLIKNQKALLPMKSFHVN